MFGLLAVTPIVSMIGIKAVERKKFFRKARRLTTLTPSGGIMTARLEARVYGLVQGVFFRHFTRQTAQELGIVGSVSNQPDGTVLAIAEGSRESLELLLEWLHHGPELARVDRVDVQWGQALGAQSGFSIRR